MKKFAVIGDSTCDLRQDTREELGIDYFMMNVVFNDIEKKADLDWKEYSAKELYDDMRNKKRVKTTQVPVEEFIRVFEKHLSQGEDVIYISCSSALSGSINVASIAAEEMKEKYKDAKIILFDSKISCLGQGMMLIEAAKMRNNGATIEEVEKRLIEMKENVNQFCVPETLEYLRKAGRVKASTAFFGNLIGIKPIMVSSLNGENVAIEKVKGRRASLNRIVDLAANAIKNPKDSVVYVVHSDCEEDANYVISLIKEKIQPKDVYVNILGPIIGASVGPGAVAIYVEGNRKTI
ncbi:MAG: DegV family protein [Bacilli bacterium]